MDIRTNPPRERRPRLSTAFTYFGGTKTRRGVFRWIAAALLLMGSALPAAATGPDFKDVRIAGTFNNWTTNDDAYRLTKTGERYELVRFWSCGEYQFKFVFDSTWDKHLGDSGGGQLGQPGENIKLAVPESGEYLVWLDVEKKEWGSERRPASRPHAVIHVQGTFQEIIMLDASASAARLDHPIKEFRWEISPEALDLHCNPLTSLIDHTPYAAFVAPRPGDYQVRLTVSDGEYDDTAIATVRTREGWGLEYFVVPQVRAGVQLGHKPMLPLPDGRLVASIPGEPGQELAISLKTSLGDRLDKLVSPCPPRRTGPDSRVTVGRTPRVAVFDPRTNELSLQDSGWHEFFYVPKEDSRLEKGLSVERVEVVGDFNGWQLGSTPLVELDEWRLVEKPERHNKLMRVFRRILELPDGVYHYKILVNGCIWLEDPNGNSELREPDNRGGFNSGVLVGLDGTKLGPPKPDHVNSEALKHDPVNGKYLTPIARNLIVLTLRTLANDVDAVEVIRPGGGSHVAMRRVDSQFGFDYWSAQVLTGGDGGEPGGPWSAYAFRLTDGSEHLVFGRKGVAADPNDPGIFFGLDAKMEFQTPDWAKTAVWYQIFPERFRNGDPNNDPPRTVPWTHEWFKPYRGHEKGARKDSRTSSEPPAGDFVEEGNFSSYIFNRRYGGDIQGIQEKLPYLRELGVTAIYLNPIFLGESLHKYDASDFRHIDDFFGVKDSLRKITGETTDPATWKWSESDRVFLDFIKEAHRQGFKVIIDGVFNHVGRDFWAFKDVVKNGKDSPYAGWFEIKSWEPFHYVAWDGDDGHLPKLKHDEAKGLAEPIREHLFAVTRRWMDPNGDGDPSDGIDGWRLDVAGDINANFWSDWRKVVKSVNPDAYIVAELWEESRAWLDGKTFDAVMNYPFARACQKFFVNKKKAIKPAAFDKQLRENLSWYLPQVNYVLQNLLDSHDTDRAASMFMNPDLEYDKANRLQDNGPDYNPARPTPECYHKLKLEVMFQMAFLGSPMVYYGDEVGMYGADDPSSRKPMYWEELMPYDDPDERIVPGLRDHYRRMIAIRNTNPALQLGSFETLLMKDSLRMYAFARTLGNDTIVIVLNNSDKPHKLDVPVSWPAGSKVVRLDDPAVCEVVDPPAAQPKARPTIRLKEPRASASGSSPKVVDGRLKGITLEPRTGAMFRLAN
jgi:cyclomaltodextrinase / maltogenic alpha-amylase / neopullulanase